MNRVTFHISAERQGRKLVQFYSARVVTPLGKEFHVSYHPHIGPDGQRGGINFGFNGRWTGDSFEEARETGAIWLEDRDPDDFFCSEFFAALTGKFPYEVEAKIKPNEDFVPFPE